MAKPKLWLGPRCICMCVCVEIFIDMESQNLLQFYWIAKCGMHEKIHGRSEFGDRLSFCWPIYLLDFKQFDANFDGWTLDTRKIPCFWSYDRQLFEIEYKCPFNWNFRCVRKEATRFCSTNPCNWWAVTVVDLEKCTALSTNIATDNETLIHRMWPTQWWILKLWFSGNCC